MPFKVLSIAVTLVIPSSEIALIQPLTHLEKKQKIEWKLAFQTGEPKIFIPDYDIIIFHRTVEPVLLNLLEMAKNLGKPTIYDIDDNFLAIPDLPQGKYYRQSHIREAAKEFMRHCNAVKVHSRQMQEIASRYNENVFLEPDCFDFSLIEGLAQRAKPPGVTVIGYSGTRYRDHDFVAVTPAIRRIMRDFQDRVQFEFMGFIPGELEGIQGVSFTPWNQDYKSFIRERYQRNWDIGLAPLQNILFNLCKSNNKYREYGGSGIAGIYANLPVYSGDVKHGVNGLLADNNEDSWYGAMRRLIEDLPLRKKIAENAQRHVLENYSVEQAAHGWWRVLREVQGIYKCNPHHAKK